MKANQAKNLIIRQNRSLRRNFSVHVEDVRLTDSISIALYFQQLHTMINQSMTTLGDEFRVHLRTLFNSYDKI